jgi:DNA-directed RNA polymerase specialized sigma24 family protein
MLESDQNGVSLDAVAARTGTPEQIERAILLQEVLAHLTPEERRVCIWKKAGYTSEEIAEYRGGTASAVHILLFRAREKIRRLLGGEFGDARRRAPAGVQEESDSESLERGGADDENPDGE